jgi:hypothetical protein
MNSNTDCKNRCEAIAALVLDELEPQAADELREHIGRCQTCRSLHQVLTNEEKAIESAFAAIAERSETLQDNLVRGLQKEPHKPLRRSTLTLSTIFKSRTTRLAAAAVMTVAVLTGIHQFVGPQVAWAAVLKNVQNAKTVRWKTTITAQGHESQIMHAMVVEPDYVRFELSDGPVFIMDRHKGNGLILDYPAKGQATLGPVENDRIPDFYNVLRNFRDLPGFSVKEIGTRRIEGRRATGFKVKKEGQQQERTIWVDPESELPIRIEETEQDHDGNVIHLVTTDIMFDVDLDMSLFSLEPPDGYELKKVDLEPVRRVKSAVNVDRILKACRKYAAEHGGQWPDTLNELVKYAVHEETFINPRQPGRKVGYIYLKPPVSAPEDRIVLYEAYDEWNGGINVGYASTRVQFVRDKSEFENQLKESSSPK